MNTEVESIGNDEIEEIRRAALYVIEHEKLTQRQAAQACGVAEGTLGPFLKGNYAGRQDRVAKAVERWLKQRDANRALTASLREAPGFQQTETATEVGDLLTLAQLTSMIVIVEGYAGIGKTTTCRQYMAERPNVHMLTVSPLISSPSMVFRELLSVLGDEAGHGARLTARALRLLRDRKALLIVDEAQHLTAEAIDALRYLHDNAPCGIALVGNHGIYQRLRAGRAGYDQIKSRISGKFAGRGRKADVQVMLDAWGIEEGPVRKRLTAIGSKPGALRVLNNVLTVASLLQQGGKRQLDVALIDEAYARTSVDLTANQGGSA